MTLTQYSNVIIVIYFVWLRNFVVIFFICFIISDYAFNLCLCVYFSCGCDYYLCRLLAV